MKLALLHEAEIGADVDDERKPRHVKFTKNLRSMGKSQGAIAREVDVDKSTVSRWKAQNPDTRREPGLEHLKRLRKSGVDPQMFVKDQHRMARRGHGYN